MSDVEYRKGDDVVMWDIERLKPYDKNAKIHDEEKIGILATNIRKFGYRKERAIEILEDGTIVNGHGRLKALQKLGSKQAPVVILRDMSDVEIKAYRLADNRASEGKTDADLLGEQMRWLDEQGFDLMGMFSDNEMKFALEDIGEISLGQITDDLSAEVDSFSDRTANKLASDKGRKAAIGEALGFKEISAEQRRLVSRLMTLLHVQYPSKSPIDAFMAMVTDYMEQTK